jgi:tetratricopeptide (TPR) repeat protein
LLLGTQQSSWAPYSEPDGPKRHDFNEVTVSFSKQSRWELRNMKGYVVILECGFALLCALMILGLSPVSPCWSQKTGKKREKYWNPAGGAPRIIRRAQLEYGKQNYERALVLYKEALETLPEGYLSGFGAANIHFEIGTCYTQLQRYNEAIAAIRKSDSFYPDPDYLATHCAWLGMVYSRIEDYSTAEQYWQKATERDPTQSVYYAGLANNSVRLGHYDKAQKAIDQGRRLAATPDAQDAFKEAQIIIYLAKGNYAELQRLTGDARLLGAYLLDTQSGSILINCVFRGGPAQLAGLATGDIIESLNGKSVKNVNDFFAALAAVPFAATAVIRIKRDLTSQDKYVIAGAPTNLPELAATAKK